MSVGALLGAIHVFRVVSTSEQVAVGESLSQFLSAHPRVRLVVLDSVAFHFRHGFDDYSQRTRLLLAHGLTLLRCAVQHRIAAVVVNQVTTKVTNGEENGSTFVAPALGASWAHVPQTRLVLSRPSTATTPERVLIVDKSAGLPRQETSYCICSAGFRSACVARKRAADGNHVPVSENNPPLNIRGV